MSITTLRYSSPPMPHACAKPFHPKILHNSFASRANQECSITSSPDFVIRSLTTAPEIEAFYRLNAQVFRPYHDTVLIATRRRRFITEAPDFHPEQLRGAFLGTTYLGGYRIPAFTMHMGPARLRICGIGGVVTHPAYRHLGIAGALMRAAITYGTPCQHALLLLDGIPNFYSQFGYVNILDEF